MSISQIRAQAAEPLRVMTFNIRYGTAPDGENAWPKRREMAFDVLRDFAPDVLGAQEALAFQLAEIIEAVPGYKRLGVGRDDGKEAGEFSAILYREDRLRPVDGGTFWLSETPDVPGSKHWGNTITRICTWAQFADLSTSPPASDDSSPRAPGATFLVYNNHWDHESQNARVKGAELVAERIADEAGADTPVLVTGDFNAGEDNAAFQRLLGGPAKLSDTFRQLHPDATDVGTFNGFVGRSDGPKIDAVLASRHWTVKDAEIVRVNLDDHYPSDHFPVTAIVELTAR